MYINLKVEKTIKVTKLEELPNLRRQMDALELKPNFSKLARELGKDRRTIQRYYYEGAPSNKRNKPSKIDSIKEDLEQLLSDESTQLFKSRKILWQYLIDTEKIKISYSAFRTYLKKNPRLEEYFIENKPSNTAAIRIETPAGKQAQIDWKEDIQFLTKDGEIIKLNIFCMVCSYSRYKIFHVTQSRTQDTLLSCLTESFEHIGGVPQTIVCDNMKTIMDIARTQKHPGKINARFLEYSREMGFEVKPCIAYRPETKGKVENIVKLLDEIYAYNGTINYEELVELVSKITTRWNLTIHQTTKEIPMYSLEKEKDSLNPLPHERIRNQYKIITSKVKVNKSSMITYKQNQYSVPPKYIGKSLEIQIEDNYLYIYNNMKLVVSHLISNKTLNYNKSHYNELTKLTWGKLKAEEITKQAKENLRLIGERFNDN